MSVQKAFDEMARVSRRRAGISMVLITEEVEEEEEVSPGFEVVGVSLRDEEVFTAATEALKVLGRSDGIGSQGAEKVVAGRGFSVAVVRVGEETPEWDTAVAIAGITAIMETLEGRNALEDSNSDPDTPTSAFLGELAKWMDESGRRPAAILVIMAPPSEESTSGDGAEKSPPKESPPEGYKNWEEWGNCMRDGLD